MKTPKYWKKFFVGAVRPTNIKPLIEERTWKNLPLETTPSKRYVDSTGALARELRSGITSQEVYLTEDSMTKDMVSKSIISLTRKSSENLFEDSHDEDSDDWIRKDETDNDFDKALFKMVWEAEKDLTKEQLEKLKALLFEFKDVWRKYGPAKVIPLVLNLNIVQQDTVLQRIRKSCKNTSICLSEWVVGNGMLIANGLLQSRSFQIRSEEENIKCL
jgi:hypothetical protein